MLYRAVDAERIHFGLYLSLGRASVFCVWSLCWCFLLEACDLCAQARQLRFHFARCFAASLRAIARRAIVRAAARTAVWKAGEVACTQGRGTAAWAPTARLAPEMTDIT